MHGDILINAYSLSAYPSLCYHKTRSSWITLPCVSYHMLHAINDPMHNMLAMGLWGTHNHWPLFSLLLNAPAHVAISFSFISLLNNLLHIYLFHRTKLGHGVKFTLSPEFHLAWLWQPGRGGSFQRWWGLTVYTGQCCLAWQPHIPHSTTDPCSLPCSRPRISLNLPHPLYAVSISANVCTHGCLTTHTSWPRSNQRALMMHTAPGAHNQRGGLWGGVSLKRVVEAVLGWTADLKDVCRSPLYEDGWS